jgi:polyisoprenoid-binding protein YceI
MNAFSFQRTAAALLLGAAAVSGAWAQQKLAAAQSEIAFTSRQMGVPVDGKFTRFDAQLTFDPKKPETSKVAFTVDLTSVAIGSAEVETELAKPGWFDTKKQPQATFQSTAFKPAGAGKFEVSGKLAIKGQSQDVVVPVTVQQSGTNATATAQAPGLQDRRRRMERHQHRRRRGAGAVQAGPHRFAGVVNVTGLPAS